jgi:hypothetical protein
MRNEVGNYCNKNKYEEVVKMLKILMWKYLQVLNHSLKGVSTIIYRYITLKQEYVRALHIQC